MPHMFVGGDQMYVPDLDDVHQVAEQSITQLGQDAYWESVNRSASANDMHVNEPGSIARDGQNTFWRENRRSPADGTFRTQMERNTDWETFRAPLDRRGVDAFANMDADTHEVRVPRGWSQIEAGDEAGHNQNVLRNERRQNIIRQTLDFETKDGKAGQIVYRYNPATKDIHIGWMGASLSGTLQEVQSNSIKPHQLGVDKVQELFKQLAERHPEAETISALRVSGARASAGTTGNVVRQIPRDKMEPVVVPSLGHSQPDSRGFGAPGQRLTDLY